MDGRNAFLYDGFLRHLPYAPTPGQEEFFRRAASFITGDDADILVLNGYAGTGKTTAVSAVIAMLAECHVPSVLLAPTGRSAKVLSAFAERPAYTVHKHIYRQKSVGGDGFGQFSLAPNKARDTLFVVDEASLIGIDAGREGSGMFGSGNLLEDLVTFVRNGVDCRLLLIGDMAQLPPVGLDVSPALSHDMDGLGGVVYAELTDVVRQQQDSGILYNATRVRERLASCSFGLAGDPDGGGPVPLETRGFPDIVRIGGGELLEALSDAYSRYGEEETVVLCRSNKRAIRYNAGIRARVQFKEEQLVRGDRLMIVRNCYHFADQIEEMAYIANGDIADLRKIGRYEERYGLHFAEARLSFPDYGGQELVAKVILDTLESESASLTYEQQNALYQGVNEDYSHITSKRKRYEAVREDPYYNALQLKYAQALTCHKSQGGQWACVFVDNPFWQEEVTVDDLKWLYTALTRAVEKVYLVNFDDTWFA